MLWWLIVELNGHSSLVQGDNSPLVQCTTDPLTYAHNLFSLPSSVRPSPMYTRLDCVYLRPIPTSCPETSFSSKWATQLCSNDSDRWLVKTDNASNSFEFKMAYVNKNSYNMNTNSCNINKLDNMNKKNSMTSHTWYLQSWIDGTSFV